MGVTWASFHNSGKCPTSKRLLNSLDMEKEMGVEMRLINFPGIPHSDNWDQLVMYLTQTMIKHFSFVLELG